MAANRTSLHGIICMYTNELLQFLVYSNGDYPIYIENAVLNTNPQFNHSALNSLATLVTENQLNITNFTLPMPEAGIYVFGLRRRQDSLFIVRVMDLGSKCPGRGFSPFFSSTPNTVQIQFESNNVLQVLAGSTNVEASNMITLLVAFIICLCVASTFHLIMPKLQSEPKLLDQHQSKPTTSSSKASSVNKDPPSEILENLVDASVDLSTFNATDVVHIAESIQKSNERCDALSGEVPLSNDSQLESAVMMSEEEEDLAELEEKIVRDPAAHLSVEDLVRQTQATTLAKIAEESRTEQTKIASFFKDKINDLQSSNSAFMESFEKIANQFMTENGLKKDDEKLRAMLEEVIEQKYEIDVSSVTNDMNEEIDALVSANDKELRQIDAIEEKLIVTTTTQSLEEKRKFEKLEQFKKKLENASDDEAKRLLNEISRFESKEHNLQTSILKAREKMKVALEARRVRVGQEQEDRLRRLKERLQRRKERLKEQKLALLESATDVVRMQNDKENNVGVIDFSAIDKVLKDSTQHRVEDYEEDARLLKELASSKKELTEVKVKFEMDVRLNEMLRIENSDSLERLQIEKDVHTAGISRANLQAREKRESKKRLADRLQKLKLRRQKRISDRVCEKQNDGCHNKAKLHRKMEDRKLGKILLTDELEEIFIQVKEVMRERHALETTQIETSQKKEKKELVRELLFFIAKQKRDAVQTFFQHVNPKMGKLMVDGFNLVEEWIDDNVGDNLVPLHNAEKQRVLQLQTSDALDRVLMLPWSNAMRIEHVRSWCSQQRRALSKVPPILMKNNGGGNHDDSDTLRRLAVEDLLHEVPELIATQFLPLLKDVDQAVKERFQQIKQLVNTRLNGYASSLKSASQQSNVTISLQKEKSSVKKMELQTLNENIFGLQRTLEKIQETLRTTRPQQKQHSFLLSPVTDTENSGNEPMTPTRASTIRERLLKYKSFTKRENLRQYIEKTTLT
eukprot:g1251.t1